MTGDCHVQFGERLVGKFRRPTHLGFLSSEEAYQKVRDLIKANKVYFGYADLMGSNQMLSISEVIKEKKLPVSSLYISNIAEWISTEKNKEGLAQLKTILESFISSSTTVIDAFYPTNSKKGSGPPQRITLGRVPSTAFD